MQTGVCHSVPSPIMGIKAGVCRHCFMSGVFRIGVPGVSHPITQWGNDTRDVFFADEAKGGYLEFLGEQGAKYGIRIDGYCLMRNHVHIMGLFAEKSVGAHPFVVHLVGEPYALMQRPFTVEPFVTRAS